MMLSVSGCSYWYLCTCAREAFESVSHAYQVSVPINHVYMWFCHYLLSQVLGGDLQIEGHKVRALAHFPTLKLAGESFLKKQSYRKLPVMLSASVLGLSLGMCSGS
jgi:hypothetical protein